jgi:two-component system, cell cycle sensor histidine kinase and response regulator CckA
MSAQATVLQKRILLADDRPEVRGVIRMMLDLDGHTVVEAADGREALSLFAPGRFDLVMTDYAMPEMTGDELAQKIKELAPSQPVLMVTGSGQLLGGVEIVADAILAKPFSLLGLRCAIAELCSIPAHPAGASTTATEDRQTSTSPNAPCRVRVFAS